MRKLLSVALLIVVVLSLSLPAVAQDEMMITCDSTLVTLLFVAEYSYGFHSMMDVSSIDKGQYAPLFESMMAMMEDDMMDEDMAEEEMMEEEMAEDAMMDDMMMLAPGVVEGEPAECSALRAEIEAYLYDHFSMAMMAEENM